MIKTKINIYLGDGFATSSQSAVHHDSLTVDVADVADHEPFACGDHTQIQPGNLNQDPSLSGSARHCGAES